MDYSIAHDDAINIAVGEEQGWNAYYIHDDGSVTFRDDNGRLRGRKNYCNNPADAWPIIQRRRIGIAPGTTSDRWAAYHGDWDIFFADKNPLRAAMVVFLMMREKVSD